MTTLHFITLTQPWATLMAIGLKMNETRGWTTRFRGSVAIHAARSFPRQCRYLCLREPFLSGICSTGIRSVSDLPLGMVLAVTEIYECVSTEQLVRRPDWELSPAELAFGDYSAGRFAFLTRGVRLLSEPFSMKGALGIRHLPRAILEDELAPINRVRPGVSRPG